MESAAAGGSTTTRELAVHRLICATTWLTWVMLLLRSDPTNGQVDYLSQAEATKDGLAYVQSDGVVVMKVDNTTKLASGEKRKS